ncbi:MAG: 7-carboxy-7-deazaguanine synthase QueE [Lysobacterales bacterium]
MTVNTASVANAEAGAIPRTDQLKLTEIFYSIQGESRTFGKPTVFIRLTGCPLRCTYCDTAYAFHGGEWFTFDAIMAEVDQYNAGCVTVTGGEPLAQKRCVQLLKKLCDAGYQVSLETSGALDISEVDPRVSRVLDLKTPASGESHRNLWSNLEQMTVHDQLKFVICNRGDYDWARSILKANPLPEGLEVLLSPSYEEQNLTTLAEWILEDRLNVRLQPQLHKILWGDEQGK